MIKTKQSRRQFVKSSVSVLTGTIVATSGMLSMMAPSRSWALNLDALSSTDGESILVAAKTIFPHKDLDDAIYALLVKDLDGAAKGSGEVKKLLTDGVVDLDKRAGGSWLEVSKEKQHAIIKEIAGSDFFEKIRGTGIVSLYNNDMAWAHFGYEGSSFDKGGYFNRGFQDLDWLPDPLPEDSPAKM